jgi:hypothetical protein
MWMAEWGKSERQSSVKGERREQIRLFCFFEAYHLAPPEGSGEVAEFISRNHEWAMSPGA